jgi:hypothetical protein
MKTKTGQSSMVLASYFSVELPGIEPELLPGKMHSELLFRYVSFPFSPARYLRLCFRVLTASRAVQASIGLRRSRRIPPTSASSRASVGHTTAIASRHRRDAEDMSVIHAELMEKFYFGDDAVLLAMDGAGVDDVLAAARHVARPRFRRSLGAGFAVILGLSHRMKNRMSTQFAVLRKGEGRHSWRFVHAPYVGALKCATSSASTRRTKAKRG